MSLENAFLVRGLVFADPKPRRASGLRTVQLDSDEIPHMRRNLVGKAVDIEHSDIYAGFVIGSHHTASNDILVDLIIDTKLKAGQEAKEGVMSGRLRGLSFRAYSLTNGATGIRYTSHYPFEVSLVAEGAVERSSIVFWGDFATGIRISKSGVSRVFRIPQLKMDSTEQENKRTRTSETPEVDQRLLDAYNKAKPLLDQLSDDPNNLAAIIQLASEGIENRRKTFTSALKDGGLAEFVAKTCSAEDQQQFNNEVYRLSCSAEPIPAMFRIAASAVEAANNYQALLAKGEANIGKNDVRQSPPSSGAGNATLTVTAASSVGVGVGGGLPKMVGPASSEMRVPKTAAESILKNFEQNRAVMQQILSSSSSALPAETQPAEIASRLAQTKVVLE